LRLRGTFDIGEEEKGQRGGQWNSLGKKWPWNIGDGGHILKERLKN